jgi:hypothetical protein
MMPDFFSFFPYPFLIVGVVWIVVSFIFFSHQRKNIISNFKQADSKELKNIKGSVITDKGPLSKGIEWCSFDLLINENSIFLFEKSLYFIPSRNINLVFSNSDHKNTKKPTLLREFKINKNSVELVYYPSFLIARSRKIYLKNLNPEQILLLENALNNKSRRMY